MLRRDSFCAEGAPRRWMAHIGASPNSCAGLILYFASMPARVPSQSGRLRPSFHQSIGRRRGLVYDLLEIDVDEMAVANHDAAVYANKLNIGWMTTEHERIIWIAHRSEVWTIRPHSNKVSSLAGFQRAGDIAKSQGASALDRREFNKPLWLVL